VSAKKNDKPVVARSSSATKPAPAESRNAAKPSRGFFDEDEWS